MVTVAHHRQQHLVAQIPQSVDQRGGARFRAHRQVGAHRAGPRGRLGEVLAQSGCLGTVHGRRYGAAGGQ